MPGREAEPPEGAVGGFPVKWAEEVGGEGAPDEVLGLCHESLKSAAAGLSELLLQRRGSLLLPPEALERAPGLRFHLALRRSGRSPVLEYPLALVDYPGVRLAEGSHHPLKDELSEIQGGVRGAQGRRAPEKGERVILPPVS